MSVLPTLVSAKAIYNSDCAYAEIVNRNGIGAGDIGKACDTAIERLQTQVRENGDDVKLDALIVLVQMQYAT